MAYINFDGNELEIPCGDLVKIATGHLSGETIAAGETKTYTVPLSPTLTGYTPFALNLLGLQKDLILNQISASGMKVTNPTASAVSLIIDVGYAYIKDEFIS